MATDGQQRNIDTGPGEALETHLVPTIFGPWAAEVVGRAQPSSGDHVLDIGCGTGPAARMAAERVGPSGRVIGIDVNAGMLQVARDKAAQAGLEIEWQEADALDLPFEDESFDTVTCCQTLQFLPDKAAALRAIRRVLKPGGRLGASVWCEVEACPGHFAVAKALASLSGTEPPAMPPFSLSDADDIRSLAAAAGFADIVVDRVRKVARFASSDAFVEALAAGAPSTRLALAALDPEGRSAVMAHVAESLAPFTADGGLSLPMESHILLARA